MGKSSRSKDYEMNHVINKRIILIVNDFSDGAGKIAQLLALEFERNNNVSLLLMSPRTRAEPRFSMKSTDVISFNFSMHNTLVRIVLRIKSLRNIFLSNKPDIIISFINNNNTLVGLSLIGTKFPLIVSERGNPIEIHPKFLWLLLRRIAYRRANVISVLFDAFKGFDNERYLNKYIVTPNPVLDPGVTRNLNTIKRNGGIKFVSFGRIAKIKRFDLMIKIFASIQAKFPNSKLTIYGDGPEKENISNLIDDMHLSGKVFLNCATNDVYKKMMEADIYLMTSIQEGFPNALCEALSVGLPSVSFRCHEGLQEIVDNGTNGFLVEEGNLIEFCGKVEQLIFDESLYLSISKNAKKIVKDYSIEHFFSIWENNCSRRFNNQS